MHEVFPGEMCLKSLALIGQRILLAAVRDAVGMRRGASIYPGKSLGRLLWDVCPLPSWPETPAPGNRTDGRSERQCNGLPVFSELPDEQILEVFVAAVCAAAAPDAGRFYLSNGLSFSTESSSSYKSLSFFTSNEYFG